MTRVCGINRRWSGKSVPLARKKGTAPLVAPCPDGQFKRLARGAGTRLAQPTPYYFLYFTLQPYNFEVVVATVDPFKRAVTASST